MAVVKSPLFAQEAHGALGGIEYRTGTYGNIVGRRSIGSQPSSPAQRDHRALFALATHRWSLLTADQQRAWDTVAIHPETGRNAWMRYAVQNIHAEYGTQYTPIPPSPITFVDDLTITQDAPGSLSYALTWTPSGTGWEYLNIYSHEEIPSRSSPTPSKFRLVNTAAIQSGNCWVHKTVAAMRLWVLIKQIDPGTGLVTANYLISTDAAG